MPCLHCKITIIKRSNNESAVSAAAYQSGEKLFSEYDQEQKYYPYKNEVTYKEIMLPPHAPPEFADRNTLWNSAEAQEKQWNSQLVRKFVLAIPRETHTGSGAGHRLTAPPLRGGDTVTHFSFRESWSGLELRTRTEIRSCISVMWRMVLPQSRRFCMRKGA